MAALPQDFNPQEEKERKAFDPLPVGDYQMVVTESEMKPTSNGRGHYLQLTMEVIDGDHKGRKLWERLNLDNPSDEAVGIARQTLAEICKAIGVMTPKDSVDLHDLPFVAKVGMKKRTDTGELENRIKKYMPKNGNGTNGGGHQQHKAVAPTTPPWKKKQQEAAAAK